MLGFLKKKEPLVAFDIGSGFVKMLELDVFGSPRQILSIARESAPADLFTNNTIAKPDELAEVLTRIVEANELDGKRVVTAIPTPAAFTKRIKVNKVDPAELRSAIQFEAGNFIPHKLDAVRLDFHVMGEVGKNQLDVLVVAVKNEVIDAVLDAFALAALDVAVVDVDSLAVHNLVETAYPELSEKTIAAMTLGQRHCAITISRQGVPLFTGDISTGVNEIIEDYATQAGVAKEQARATIEAISPGAAAPSELPDLIERSVTELSRQLTFFWNTCGAEGGIDHILLGGGGSLLPGIIEKLSEKAGVPAQRVESLRGLQPAATIDPKLLMQLEPFMSVAAGLAQRTAGDTAL